MERPGCDMFCTPDNFPRSAARGGQRISPDDIEAKLHALTNSLVLELISLTPETMREFRFEIVSTDDGGADIGLLQNHPDAKYVALSEAAYHYASHYLPLVRQYVPGWRRTQIVIQHSEEVWKVTVNLQRT